MKVLIVEDEINALHYLERLLKQIRKDVSSCVHTDGVKSTVNYLSANPIPDLIFMDIQLSDGISFDVFSHVDVSCPVIFTTAYDTYAIDAFKVNSVDYLLKPIDEAELKQALDKYDKHHGIKRGQGKQGNLNGLITSLPPTIKKRCLVKRGAFFDYIEVPDIMFINSDQSLTFLYTRDGRRHLYNKTVEGLYAEVDKSAFFQINRSQVVHIDAIREIHPYLNQRLLLKLHISLPESLSVVVSRSKVSAFKDWVDS